MKDPEVVLTPGDILRALDKESARYFTSKDLRFVWNALAGNPDTLHPAMKDRVAEVYENVRKARLEELTQSPKAGDIPPAIKNEEIVLSGPILDSRFSKTEFLVEATDFEECSLYQRNCQSYLWDRHPLGAVVCVGQFGGQPVNVHVAWVDINHHLVAFWHCCSEVSHRRLISDWFDKHCNPMCDGGSRQARIDASNFHLCLQHCKGQR